MSLKKDIKRFLVVLLTVSGCCGGLFADFYEDEISQPDGVPDNWVVNQPAVAVEGEALALTPGGAEPHAFAATGQDPIFFDNISVIEFDLTYPGDPAAWPPDHGGVLFCCQSISNRWLNSGYYIDYLDGNWRIVKMVNGTHTQIGGNPVLGGYEGHWTIILDGTTIHFLLDDVEQCTADDAGGVPYQSGFCGFWAYTNEGQKMVVDNLAVEYTPAPCPMLNPPSLIGAVDGPSPTVEVRIPFNANATENYVVTLTSNAPEVAAPAGHTDGALDVIFAPGDARTRSIPLAVTGMGRAQISLSIAGEDCPGLTTDVEIWQTAHYAEDFSQPDGPPDNGVVIFETAEIVNEQLSLWPLEPGVAEPSIWAGMGGIPFQVQALSEISFTIEFPGEPTDWVGDHGGIMFNCVNATNRWNNPGAAYTIDYFTNTNDPNGPSYRIMHAVNGAQTALQIIYTDSCDPDWVITATPTGFIFDTGNIDPVEISGLDPATLYGGYLGFWCYHNQGQNMVIDDVEVTFATNPCMTVTPPSAVNHPANAPTVCTVEIPFGANFTDSYVVSINSTHPNVALPAGAWNDTLDLVFPAGGAMVQTFEIQCFSPGTTDLVLTSTGVTCPEAVVNFTVLEPGQSFFEDSFSQPDGLPENWTIYNHLWHVADGAMTVECLPGEGYTEDWVWAGDPPVRLEAIDYVSFILDLENLTGDPVGRHGGVMFCAQDPTTRYDTSGYEIDWIDRENDRGFRFMRSDNGVHTMIAGPTFQDAELGSEWQIEFEGELIRLYVDGAMIFEVADATYREGHLGFWTYCNGTAAKIDDVTAGQYMHGILFQRGDVNADDSINLADAIALLTHLFADGPDPACMDAADANNDETLNLADAIKILDYLFGSGAHLPMPFMECGEDPDPAPGETDKLDCKSYDKC